MGFQVRYQIRHSDGYEAKTIPIAHGISYNSDPFIQPHTETTIDSCGYRPLIHFQVVYHNGQLSRRERRERPELRERIYVILITPASPP